MITPDTYYSVLRYSLDEYPWPKLIRKALRERNLAGLRDDTLPRHSRATDQRTRWHERFYTAREVWAPLYHEFVISFVARQFAEPFYFQAIPTFRVHLPFNVAVGEYHTDGHYGHPAGEQNFWLPLTEAVGTNSIHLCDHDDPDVSVYRRSIRAWPGDVVVFDAVSRCHGNELNVEPCSRVSFDFRCLPVRLYRETEACSVNMGKRFVPGEYYAAEPVAGLA